jgi:hypothetical protein
MINDYFFCLNHDLPDYFDYPVFFKNHTESYKSQKHVLNVVNVLTRLFLCTPL